MIKTRLVQVVESRFVPSKYGEFQIIPDPNFVQSLTAKSAVLILPVESASIGIDLIGFFSQDHCQYC